MKKSFRVSLVFFLVIFSVMFSGSGYASQATMPKVMTVVSHGMATGGYAMVSGIATVLSKHLPPEFKVMPTTGISEILPLVATGQALISGSSMMDTKEGWGGGAIFKRVLKGKKAPIRLLVSGSPNVSSVLAAADSGITKGEDLKGKRFIANFAGSPTINIQADAALANFGLTRDDVRIISQPGPGAAVKALIEGRADASASAVLRMGVVKELEAKRGARFISYDPSPEAAKRLLDPFPARLVRVEPQKGLVGVREPIYMAQYEWYFWCHRDLISDEMAYQIVKTMWDYNDEITVISKRLSGWTRDRFIVTNPTIPYHPGAIRFYKEKGVWTETMEKIQARLIGME